MPKINTAIVGYGFSGSIFHAPIITTIPEFKLTKIVSSNPEKVYNDHPNVEVIRNVNQIFNDPEIDLIIITTPNTTHYPFAKEALKANKHVIVEKPFVIHLKEAEELVNLAEEKKRILSVYHNRRWDNDFLTIKEIMTNNLLGKVYTYKAHFDRFRYEVKNRWREQNLDGSGVLYDLGSHLIDQALNLFGFPKTIFADLKEQREKAKTTDYFHLILGYDALRVILHSGSLVMNPGPRYEIHGDKGSFIKYGIDSQEEQLKQGNRPGDYMWGHDDGLNYGELTQQKNGVLIRTKVPTVIGSYEAFYQGIANAILSNKPVPVSAVEAMDVIKVIEYAIKSNQEKRVIEIE